MNWLVKNTIFLFVCMVTLSALVFLYIKGENRLNKSHQQILTSFSRAENLEALLRIDVLKVKNFMLSNYDSIVSTSEGLEQVCQNFRKYTQKLNAQDSMIFRKPIMEYCNYVSKRLIVLERFKSSNAIFRNSYNYLQKLALQKDSNKEMTFIWSALVYSRMHTSDSSVKKRINDMMVEKSDAESSFASLHTLKVLQIKKEIDELGAVMLAEKSDMMLMKLRAEYFQYYEEESKKTARYRSALFGFSVLFFILIILGLIKLLRASSALRYANTNLEHRVQKRTKDLEESNKRVLEQQKTIVSSSKLAAIGEMSGQIAHEMNTPLGVISLAASSLKKKVAVGKYDEDLFEKKLDLILKVTDKLSRIIESVRKLSKGEDGEEHKAVRVMDLIEDAALLCEGCFKKYNIELKTNILINRDEEAICHSTEIEQVLINLFSNAIDAVRWSSKEEKWVMVEVTKENGQICIAVSDSGDGVPEEIQGKIFEPKFSTKSLADGTGFGLALSTQIIEQHGGVLRLDLNKEETTFVFNLSLKHAA